MGMATDSSKENGLMTVPGNSSPSEEMQGHAVMPPLRKNDSMDLLLLSRFSIGGKSGWSRKPERTAS